MAQSSHLPNTSSKLLPIKSTKLSVATASCSERETFGRFLAKIKITSLVKKLGIIDKYWEEIAKLIYIFYDRLNYTASMKYGYIVFFFFKYNEF